jgi:hypothetical protein
MINNNLSIRKSQRGDDYIFFKTPKMKKPQFYDIKPFKREIAEDYRTCELELLIDWIKMTYNI